MGNEKKSKDQDKDKKKVKLVRDSFCMPKDEYGLIDVLKGRALKQGIAIKKSELLRAGLATLSSLKDDDLKLALSAVPTLKTGRPAAAVVPQATAKAVAPQPKAPSKPSAPARTKAPASVTTTPVTKAKAPAAQAIAVAADAPSNPPAKPAKAAKATRSSKPASTAAPKAPATTPAAVALPAKAAN